MMIKSVAQIGTLEFDTIIEILLNTGQITSDKHIRRTAKKFFIMSEVNNRRKICAFAIQKKSRQKGYDAEIGYLFVKPEYRRSNEAVKFIQEIDRNTPGKMYITVVYPPIKKLLKRMGYEKMDSWPNDVDTNKEVDLFTNANVVLTKDKEFKDYEEDVLNSTFDQYFYSAHDINRQKYEFEKIPEFTNIVKSINLMPYKAVGLEAETIATILIKKYNDYGYNDPNEKGIWYDLAIEVFIGDPEYYPGDSDKEKLYDNLSFIKQRIGG
ncbi:MAG: hypothetical protein BWY04_01166 [candidate division CPR1 bacterium ADurb.Bin160]|uniref:Uncharacterized protein n=1 Tax=candidate division CPR1 bacterium ADurb.Bin160 TaxID=1852826 RepID=A0A1V5ZKU4_9BACT|nr:MAG: hypothetical protein BWY04_01166 [candidate division CPR1 bacterium ADurb.Bin160]